MGKADYRRLLCASQSAKCVAGYLYSAAGPGESTTDLAWDGHALIYENGERLAESTRFPLRRRLITADLDLDHLRQERMRWTSVRRLRRRRTAARCATSAAIEFELDVPAGPRAAASGSVERFPYVPADPARRDERCAEVYDIQVEALRKRLVATGLKRVVIGISGGLDSTQAALVAVRAFDRLGLPRTRHPRLHDAGLRHEPADVRQRARTDAARSASRAAEIDIRPSAELMLAAHRAPVRAGGEPVHDVTFENVQAGERTSHLFRLANLHEALVLGTGDLSELALGFTTYGVGDHMSHYNVNASVPKTLIRHLIRWLVAARQFDDATLAVLQRIADTPISPELVPGAGAGPAQSSEAVVGPYELQDFHLYYVSRFGYRPEQGRVPRARSVERRRRAARGRTRCRRTERVAYDLADDPPLARGVPAAVLPDAASSSARRCRTDRRSVRAARSRHAATGARRAIRRRRCGSTNCAPTCPAAARPKAARRATRAPPR